MQHVGVGSAVRRSPVLRRGRRSGFATLAVLVIAGFGSVSAVFPAPSARAASTAAGDQLAPEAQAAGDQLPAGAQFPAPGEPLPGTSRWDAHPVFSPDGRTTLLAGVRERSRPNGRRTSQLRAAIRVPGGRWRDVAIGDLAGIHGPGLYEDRGALSVGAVAAGPRGFLVAGSGMFSARSGSPTFLGFSWYSPDGRRWSRTDLRATLGVDAAFVPTDAVATRAGWLVVGLLSNRSLQADAAIVALTSRDGAHWKLRARLRDPWTLSGGRLSALGDRLLLSADALVCQTGAYSLVDGGSGHQARIWSSTDGGATWRPGDATAAGVSAAPEPAPAPGHRDACPDESSAGFGAEVDTRFASAGTLVGAANGRAVFASGDLSRVAVTTDLEHWQVADLPGGAPTLRRNDPDRIRTAVVVPGGAGIVLLSLGPRRDAADQELGYGSQVIAWDSPEGAAWTRLPATRPLTLTGGATLSAAPDGSVLLVGSPASDGTAPPPPQTVRRSVAGPLVAWGGCLPAPGADCAWATIVAIPAGSDLRGIDLTGATIDSTLDLAGTQLADAELEGVTAGASLFRAGLEGAHLARPAIVVAAGDTTLEGHDFGAGDLSGATFRGVDGSLADLRGTDFRLATLAYTTFEMVDLSGARFAVPADPAVAGSPGFLADVICPDGAPPDGSPREGTPVDGAPTDGAGWAGCRLAPGS